MKPDPYDMPPDEDSWWQQLDNDNREQARLRELMEDPKRQSVSEWLDDYTRHTEDK